MFLIWVKQHIFLATTSLSKVRSGKLSLLMLYLNLVFTWSHSTFSFIRWVSCPICKIWNPMPTYVRFTTFTAECRYGWCPAFTWAAIWVQSVPQQNIFLLKEIFKKKSKQTIGFTFITQSYAFTLLCRLRRICCPVGLSAKQFITPTNWPNR